MTAKADLEQLAIGLYGDMPKTMGNKVWMDADVTKANLELLRKYASEFELLLAAEKEGA